MPSTQPPGTQMPDAETDQTSCVRCSKPLSENVRFCPFCAAEQAAIPNNEANTKSSTADAPRTPKPEDFRYAKARRWGEHDAPSVGAPSLVLRAGEKIWHFEEEEAEPSPGKPRPWLVMDEQITHLAHTDRELTPDLLLSRVQALLGQDRVPVQVQLLATRWQSDGEELRPRLVASLENHRYSDIKMLLGLDYLGNWASIHLALAVEPAPLPVSPRPEPPPADPSFRHPLGGIICLVLGILGVMGGIAENGSRWDDPLRSFAPVLIGAGVILGLVGLTIYVAAFSNHGNRCSELRAGWQQEQARRKQAWEHEQRRHAQQRAMDRLSRTFKVDDMRLFSTAMREVYQRVVDDIVATGAQVARIEGGQGGFFEAQGVTQAAAPPRHSDAASLGV